MTNFVVKGLIETELKQQTKVFDNLLSGTTFENLDEVLAYSKTQKLRRELQDNMQHQNMVLAEEVETKQLEINDMKDEIDRENRVFSKLEKQRVKEIESKHHQRYQYNHYNPDGSMNVTHGFYDSIKGLPAMSKLFSDSIDKVAV